MPLFEQARATKASVLGHGRSSNRLGAVFGAVWACLAAVLEVFGIVSGSLGSILGSPGGLLALEKKVFFSYRPRAVFGAALVAVWACSGAVW